MGIKLATAVSMKPISLETESEPPLEHEELLPERALLPIEPLSDSDFDVVYSLCSTNICYLKCPAFHVSKPNSR